MRRQFGRPFPSDVFPLAATAVTDDFHRADENPIGAPWDVSAWSGAEGAISSNRFVSQDRTGYWDGGASYPWALLSGFEIVVTIGIAPSLGDSYTVAASSPNGPNDSVYVNSNVAQVNGSETISLGVSPVSGDQFGLRTIGYTLEGWYRQGSSWSLIGRTARLSGLSGLPLVYAYSDTRQLAFSDFRIAALGEIITPRRRTRARRTAW